MGRTQRVAVWTALVLLVSSGAACAAGAQYAPAYASNEAMHLDEGAYDMAGGGVAYKERSAIDFEDDAIEGELQKPDGAYLMARLPGPAGGEPETESEPVAASAPSDTPTDAAEQPRRLVIYTGAMGVLVPNADKARESFLAVVEEMGGYMQSQADSEVTVRVPAARFAELMDKVAEYGPVTSRSVDARDVTKQVFELSLRIDNAKRSRARLLELLAKAEKTEDILKIENELRRLTEEIELLEGSLRTMRDQIAYSTLTVSFQSNAPAPTPYTSRRYSRFGWINQIGAENVLQSF